MSVSLAEVALAARARRAPLAAESAGHLVLAIADQIALAARIVRQDAVELNDDGSVRLCAGEPTAEANAEHQLRVLLGELLEVASSLTPALFRVASKSSTTGLTALIGELEAALIPVNRAAARRALARLARETSRAVERGLLAEVPEPQAKKPRATPRREPEPEPVALEIEVEFTPAPLEAAAPQSAPLEETRPEPRRRRVSSTPEPLAKTPTLGTRLVSVEQPPAGDLAGPRTSTSEPVAKPLAAPPDRGGSRPRDGRRSDIGDLLKSFASDDGPTEPELRRELKKIAGLELTPPPATADPAANAEN